ncbi:MAG: DUF2889 domain-containing protein [Burkholderiaceae bacterium]
MELSDPAPRRLLHTRKIVCEGYVRDDGLWDIEASILDTKTYDYTEPYRGARKAGSEVHDMRIRLTVDESLTVKNIEVAMPQTPYPICTQAAEKFRQLIGLKIGGGWRAAVNQLVGGTNGCTHVRELLGPIATVAIQTVHGWAEDNPPVNRPGVRRPLIDASRKPGFIDGCYAWSAQRQVVADLYPDYAVKPSE